jgi:RNA polymerase sigma factor (sigma-70 family)
MARSFSSPEDDAFALRVFAERFQRQVRKASRPIFPKLLLSQRDDIIQEALVKACQSRTQFKGSTDEELLGWVLVILRNLTRDKLDARDTRPQETALPEEMVDRKAPDPARAAQEAETGDEEVPLPPKHAAWRTYVQGILDDLSPEDREVLLLHKGQGLTIPEITKLLLAEGQEVTEAAVKMRYYRALKRVIVVAEAAGVAKKASGTPKKAGPER